MVTFNDRVVSGRDIVTCEPLCFFPKISEFQFLVAHHTWIRRATGLVFAGKITDHEFFELIRLIDHVMWNSEGTGNSACVCHGLWPAAFVLRPRNAVLRPHFHRHPNDVVTLLAQQITSDAGIDSPAHAKKHPLFVSRIHRRKIDERLLLVNHHPGSLFCYPERKPRDPGRSTLKAFATGSLDYARDNLTLRLTCTLS